MRSTGRILLAGAVAACLSFASTLPKPSGDSDSTTSVTLPTLMDSSASYSSTGAEAPAAAGSHQPAGIDTPTPSSPLNTTVASGTLSPASHPDGASSNHQNCVPEPMSVVLMAGGILGLFAARRFRR